MDSENLFERLKELDLPAGKYAIFGSGPMCARGLRECRDLDIIVTEDVFDKYKNEPDWESKKTESGSVYLNNNEIELWRDWYPGDWNIQKLIKEAKIINGLPFVKLEEVLIWKRLKGRDKDLKDIELIESYFKNK